MEPDSTSRQGRQCLNSWTPCWHPDLFAGVQKPPHTLELGPGTLSGLYSLIYKMKESTLNKFQMIISQWFFHNELVERTTQTEKQKQKQKNKNFLKCKHYFHNNLLVSFQIRGSFSTRIFNSQYIMCTLVVLKQI